MDDKIVPKTWSMNGRDIYGQAPQRLLFTLIDQLKAVHCQKPFTEGRRVLFHARRRPTTVRNVVWELDPCPATRRGFMWGRQFDPTGKTPCSSAKHCLQSGARRFAAKKNVHVLR